MKVKRLRFQYGIALHSTLDVLVRHFTLIFTLFPHQAISHEDYHENPGAAGGSDIAVLKLEKDIDFQGAQKGVKCTCRRYANVKPVRKLCWVVGWGSEGADSDTVRSSWLQEVKVSDHYE